MAKCIVMRHSVLMEDEGRDSFVRQFDSKSEAQTWIKAQKGEYFVPSDYYIAKKVLSRRPR